MSGPEIKDSARGLRALLNRRAKKKTKFMDTEIEIYKLTIAEVVEIQELAKTVTESSNGLELLKKVIRLGAEGAADLTDEDFDTMPIDDLSKLSNEIMKYSGLNAPAEAGK